MPTSPWLHDSLHDSWILISCHAISQAVPFVPWFPTVLDTNGQACAQRFAGQSRFATPAWARWERCCGQWHHIDSCRVQLDISKPVEDWQLIIRTRLDGTSS